MKLQNLTVIFVIIIIPVILLLSLYISTGIKTIKYQAIYDSGLLTATHDAIYAFEQNTARDIYSDNPERKRDILKSSVKMFEKSLANTCNISSYNTDEIEEYIPAIVFGMYDGFYMYAPSGVYNSETGKTEYSHNLKNYVYYSETLEKREGWNTDAIIIYSLDNYVTVSGDFGDGYEVKSGYLIDTKDSTSDGKVYKGITIKSESINGQENIEGIRYHKEAYKFTNWFNEKIGSKVDYLKINGENDPENESSAFVQHKREIIKNKIESVLNSTITAYSNRTWGRTYSMPKLSQEDWEKIYSNISMITFFQGKSIGLTKYNGYCVLNSTNSNEYVNANLMYFIDENDEYHDIRCAAKEGENLIGYKIGDFQRIAIEETNDDGDIVKNYRYKHKELACYYCVNGSLDTNESTYKYIWSDDVIDDIKTSYWTSLGRERYRKVFNINSDIVIVSLDENYESASISNITVKYQEKYGDLPIPTRIGYTFEGWFTQESGGNQITSETIVDITEGHTLYAHWTNNPIYLEVTFDTNYEGSLEYKETVTYQERYGELPNITRQGYVFEGWFTQESGGNQITSETIVDRTGNHTLYAHWTPILYTFDVNQIINGEMYYSGGEAVYDVYKDGTIVSNQKSDYCKENMFSYGTEFEIRNINPPSGYEYIGAKIRLGSSTFILERNELLNIEIENHTSIDLLFEATPDISFEEEVTVKGGSGRNISKAPQNGGKTAEGKESMIINASFSLDKSSTEIVNVIEQTIVSTAEKSGYALIIDTQDRIVIAIYDKDIRDYRRFTIEQQLVIGEKYNVTVVYDGEKLEMYLNGEKRISERVNLTLNQNSEQSTRIGANPSGENKYNSYCSLYGKIYNVKIWYNQTFSDDYIKNISERAMNN